tara:strand:- start:126 stop:383 length:258 start_codon:yes stop_codon:yes gene_type:complete
MEFSEAALYRHFKNKNEMMIAILNYLAEGRDSRMQETIDNSISKLETLFIDQFKFFHKNRHFLVAIFYDVYGKTIVTYIQQLKVL